MSDPKTKIFIVEDETDVAFHMCRLLEREGYEVANAYNLKEAVEKFNAFLPDICVVDVFLTISLSESGLDFLRVASKTGHKFKTLVVSGRCTAEMREEIEKLPMVNFMTKPIDTDDFRAEVKRIAAEKF